MPIKTDIKPEKNSGNVVTVVHKLSHRTRLRIKKSPRTQEQLLKAQEILNGTPGVQKLEVNQQTGSMLVLHDDQAGRAIDSAIDEIAKTLGRLAPETGLEDSGLVYVANSLYPLVSMIDDKLSQWSDSNLDLKALVPLALAYMGLRTLSRTRNLLGNISPLVLFYYAFDSYHKLHRKGEFGAVPAGSGLSNR